MKILGQALSKMIWRNSSGSSAAHPEEDNGGKSPYRISTTRFDVECSGAELDSVLSHQAVDRRAPKAVGLASLSDRRLAMESSYAEGLTTVGPCDLAVGGELALLILLDQSGSMAERMPRLVGELLAIVQSLEKTGASVMLAGFTTVGWRGGQSRKAWQRAPKQFPGRLCDLLHVTYIPFDEPASFAQVEPLCAPDVLFENVDGEALQWAARQLEEHESCERVLVMLSDGAPVDDSTLQENDPAILFDHLSEVVAQLEASDIQLGAIGFDHRVDTIFPYSRVISGEQELSSALFSLINELRNTGENS